MRRDPVIVDATWTSMATDLPPVHLCGPIAEPGAAARGGYQACNRRTFDALRALGVDVRVLPFPNPRSAGVRKLAAYAAGFLRLYRAVMQCPSGSILHLTVLSAGLVYPEWILVKLARHRGLRIVFDQRAGGAQLMYETRSTWYRRFYASMASAADMCFVEGEALAPFLHRCTGTQPVHLPNHLDTDGLPDRPDDAQPLPQAPTLIYVGRVVAEKGLDEILDVCRSLHDQGLESRLQVVGEGDRRYVEQLRRRAGDLPVEWLGARPTAEVIALLSRAHFFVFPSRHCGEGQSNALTEAMACGCVAIASRHGFNDAVIANTGATLPPSARPEDYAAALLAIWLDQDRWRTLSLQARSRVRAEYSTREVMQRLLAHYRRLGGV